MNPMQLVRLLRAQVRVQPRLVATFIMLASLALVPAMSHASPGDASSQRFPGLPFEQLSAVAQSNFLELAETELCPCEGSVESLGECLVRAPDVCTEALMGSLYAMRSLHSGLGLEAARTELNAQIESVRRVHSFDLTNIPHRGTLGAPVTIVEFADFQCPHCSQASAVLNELSETLGARANLYFVNFPLASHAHGEIAALAVLAAGEQDAFWPYHDLLFERQRQLAAASSADTLLRSWAQELGLDVERFGRDLRSSSNYGRLSRHTQLGMRAGITGTPTVFINGRLYIGPVVKPALLEFIDQVLASSADTTE